LAYPNFFAQRQSSDATRTEYTVESHGEKIVEVGELRVVVCNDWFGSVVFVSGSRGIHPRGFGFSVLFSFRVRNRNKCSDNPRANIPNIADITKPTIGGSTISGGMITTSATENRQIDRAYDSFILLPNALDQT
jgi:hypothetical protein